VFKRYADYLGKKPYYSKVVFKIIPESNAREAGLRSGQLDMIMNPPVSDLESLSAQSNIKVLKAPSDRTIYVGMIVKKAPLNNKKVRQALNYAVDKKAIIKNVLFGAVNRMNSPFADSLSGYCKVGGYDYNPSKAKKLLAEAGAGKISLTIGSPSGRYLQDLQAAQAIAGYLRQVGVTVKVRTMDWPSYLAKLDLKPAKDPFDLFLLGWAPTALDGATQMELFTKANWSPKPNNTYYSDPRVEKLFAKAQRELNEKKRNKLYCQIQKKIWNDAPWIFLWSQTLILAYDSDIAGISYQPNEKFETLNAHPK
jgi:peptide/nickel transport system substrate-binding protein